MKELVGNSFELVNRIEAAKFLGVKPQTLACWAVRGTGPAPTKIGRKVLYRRDLLSDYIVEQTAPRGGNNK